MNILWKTLKLLLPMLFIFLLGNNTATGQNTRKNYIEITLKDSTTLLAELIKVEEEQLEIRILDDSLNQNTFVSLSEIKKYTRRSQRWIEYSSIPDSIKYTPKILGGRNILGFTGYNLKKGQGYYQNTLLFGQYGGYNITDRLSVEGGFELFSLLFWNRDTDSNIAKLPGFLMASKYAVLKGQNNLDINIGGLMIRAPHSEDLFSGGVAYGELAYSKGRHSISLGLGVVPRNNVISNSPLLTFGGTLQITKQIAILASTWYYQGNNTNFIYYKIGVRCEFLGIALDLAFANLEYEQDRGAISERNTFMNPRTVSFSIPF